MASLFTVSKFLHILADDFRIFVTRILREVVTTLRNS